MATIEEAQVSYLLGYTALTALIGMRLKPFHIPVGSELPCLTYKRIDTPRELTHSSSGASGDVITPRFQYDSWAKTELEAQAIATVLQGAMHMKKGSIGTAPYAKTVGLIRLDGGFPIYEAEIDVWRWVSQYVIGMVE